MRLVTYTAGAIDLPEALGAGAGVGAHVVDTLSLRHTRRNLLLTLIHIWIVNTGGGRASLFGLLLSIRTVKLEGIFAALSINMPGLDSDKQLFISKGRQKK